MTGLGRVRRFCNKNDPVTAHPGISKPRSECPAAHHRLPASNLRGTLRGFPRYPIRRVRRVRNARGSSRSRTMSTKSRSSRIIASCTSKGNESRDSSLAFPFDFKVVVPETMRELSGARTNDSSEMKEGSWAKFHQVEEAESDHVHAPLHRGPPDGETRPLVCSSPSSRCLFLRAEAIVPVTCRRTIKKVVSCDTCIVRTLAYSFVDKDRLFLRPTTRGRGVKGSIARRVADSPRRASLFRSPST